MSTRCHDFGPAQEKPRLMPSFLCWCHSPLWRRKGSEARLEKESDPGTWPGSLCFQVVERDQNGHAESSSGPYFGVWLPVVPVSIAFDSPCAICSAASAMSTLATLSAIDPGAPDLPFCHVAPMRTRLVSVDMTLIVALCGRES